MVKEITKWTRIDGREIEFVDIEAFGHKFKALLPGNAEDLITLEKEGAIYSNFHDEKTDSFKYYRIKFLPNEIFEYVEAIVAQQQYFEGFLKTNGNFDQALEFVNNKQIAERVRTYESYVEKNDKTIEVDIRGCQASFLSRELEKLVCGQKPERYELLPRINTKDKFAIILDIFDGISYNINFLFHRKHNKTPFTVEDEYDLQDILYVIIKSIFSDAKFEEHTIKHAGGTKIVDLVVPSINVVIEVKYVRNKNHASSVADEIKIDIESYHVHPNCETLCVLVYDPNKYITDPYSFMRDLTGLRVINNKKFEIKTVVKN